MSRVPFLAEGFDLPPSDYVVLGMLRQGARSGYEIKRAMQVSTGFSWRISAAQIYLSLERLERAELIRGASDPRGRRPRRAYRLARRGESALTEWLRSDGATSLELRDLGMLKLSFTDAREPGAALPHVVRLRHRSEQALRQMDGQMEREIQPGVLAVARIRMALHRSMIDCCAELERELAQGGYSR